MSRALVILYSAVDRARACKWIMQAPPRSRVEIKGEKRTLDQNAKMWSMLTDVAYQINWYGQKLTPDDWKDIFTASLRKARIVPNLDGNGFVQLGLHTSDFSKSEMSDMIELMFAFGSEKSVVWSETKSEEAA